MVPSVLDQELGTAVDFPKAILTAGSSSNTRELGKLGEEIATHYLIQNHYLIVGRNWTCKLGEVDIVAQDDKGTTVLIEVKTRRSKRDQPAVFPELAVTPAKLHKYQQLTHMYLAYHPDLKALRFDIVAITVWDLEAGSVYHIKDAYRWDD